jgi:AraC family transcriptional regulator
MKSPIQINAKQIGATEQLFVRPPVMTSCPDPSHPTYWPAIHVEYHCQPPHITPLHNTQATAIGMHVGKNIELESVINGQHKRQIIHDGEFSLYPAGMARQVAWTEENRFVILALHQDFVARVLADLGKERLDLPPRHQLYDSFLHELSRLFLEVLRLEKACDALYIESLALAMTVYLHQNFNVDLATHAKDSVGLSPQQLTQIRNYILDHVGQPIRLENLAQQLDMSMYYFSRMFKQSTGFAPYQYVLKQRIDYAQALMQSEPKLSMAEVSGRCGFTSQSHFSRQFRKLVGDNPTTYRDACL